MTVLILGIESSCDDTAAAVIQDTKILANVTANQEIHAAYGGVVPELASRAHQRHIVPTVEAALSQAQVKLSELDAIAFTAGPGLLGSLLVGSSFAKSLALGLKIPLLAVNHMQAHVLAHLIEREGESRPEFPFLCLTVSGGHTQILKVSSPYDMIVLGETIDDAAGEAFDKVAKIMGLPYPGGPLIDRYAQDGDPLRFTFAEPRVPGYNFSFSGLKTSVLYFLQKQVKSQADFVEQNLADLCASVQYRIVRILMQQLERVVHDTGLRRVALAGGVAANSGLRRALAERRESQGWQSYIPPMEYCTDNGAMIAISGYYQYLAGDFAPLSYSASARRPLKKALQSDESS